MFENRSAYRQMHKKAGLVSFEVTARETNLHIQARSRLEEVSLRHVLECRSRIENYIRRRPEFATSLSPIPADDFAPTIIQKMIAAAKAAGVGPMAAVAGAVAEHTGAALLKESPEVVVENGGDVFVKSDAEMTFGIHAENTTIFQHAGIRIPKRSQAYGICTSAGTLGHSMSLGKADAATVLAESCPLADAVATGMGNRVKKDTDIQPAIDWARSIPGIKGLIVVKNDKIGLWGDLQLVRLDT